MLLDLSSVYHGQHSDCPWCSYVVVFTFTSLFHLCDLRDFVRGTEGVPEKVLSAYAHTCTMVVCVLLRIHNGFLAGQMYRESVRVKREAERRNLGTNRNNPAAFLRAFFSAFFRLRSARHAANFCLDLAKASGRGSRIFSAGGGSGFGYWNTGKVMPSAPAFTVSTPCSQQKVRAERGTAAAAPVRSSTTSSRMPTTRRMNSSTAPSAARECSHGHPHFLSVMRSFPFPAHAPAAGRPE